MNTNERLDQDFIGAVKARDAFAVSVLRMLRAALKNAEIEKRAKQAEMKEEDVVEVLGKEVKKIKDALDSFVQGGREDLVEKSKKEIEIIERYLPKQLSEGELLEIVKGVVAKMGEVTAADFGRVMSEVMKEVKGKAEGGKVSAAVKACLK